VWTAGAVLLERGMRTRPADAPPLAVIAATLRQMAREAMQQERTAQERRVGEEME